MADLPVAPTVNHPFRYVNGCGESNRTIFTSDGGATIHIGCSVYTPSTARKTIIHKYSDRPELMSKYLAAVDRLVNDDTPFDSENYNWDKLSQLIVRSAPQCFDPDRFNWTRCSDEIIHHAPRLFDPTRYNWEGYSLNIVLYAQYLFDPDRYNWKNNSDDLIRFAPHLFDPDRFNWDRATWAVVQYAPEIYAKYKDRIKT